MTTPPHDHVNFQTFEECSPFNIFNDPWLFEYGETEPAPGDWLSQEDEVQLEEHPNAAEPQNMVIGDHRDDEIDWLGDWLEEAQPVAPLVQERTGILDTHEKQSNSRGSSKKSRVDIYNSLPSIPIPDGMFIKMAKDKRNHKSRKHCKEFHLRLPFNTSTFIVLSEKTSEVKYFAKAESSNFTEIPSRISNCSFFLKVSNFLEVNIYSWKKHRNNNQASFLEIIVRIPKKDELDFAIKIPKALSNWGTSLQRFTNKPGIALNNNNNVNNNNMVVDNNANNNNNMVDNFNMNNNNNNIVNNSNNANYNNNMVVDNNNVINLLPEENEEPEKIRKSKKRKRNEKEEFEKAEESSDSSNNDEDDQSGRKKKRKRSPKNKKQG